MINSCIFSLLRVTTNTEGAHVTTVSFSAVASLTSTVQPCAKRLTSRMYSPSRLNVRPHWCPRCELLWPTSVAFEEHLFACKECKQPLEVEQYRKSHQPEVSKHIQWRNAEQVSMGGTDPSLRVSIVAQPSEYPGWYHPRTTLLVCPEKRFVAPGSILHPHTPLSTPSFARTLAESEHHRASHFTAHPHRHRPSNADVGQKRGH